MQADSGGGGSHYEASALKCGLHREVYDCFLLPMEPIGVESESRPNLAWNLYRASMCVGRQFRTPSRHPKLAPHTHGAHRVANLQVIYVPAAVSVFVAHNLMMGEPLPGRRGSSRGRLSLGPDRQ